MDFPEKALVNDLSRQMDKLKEYIDFMKNDIHDLQYKTSDWNNNRIRYMNCNELEQEITRLKYLKKEIDKNIQLCIKFKKLHNETGDFSDAQLEAKRKREKRREEMQNEQSEVSFEDDIEDNVEDDDIEEYNWDEAFDDIDDVVTPES